MTGLSTTCPGHTHILANNPKRKSPVRIIPYGALRELGCSGADLLDQLGQTGLAVGSLVLVDHALRGGLVELA